MTLPLQTAFFVFGGSPTPNDIFAAPVTLIVPDAAIQNPVATIQVMNGSTLSNIVTAFVYKTTPEVLTFNPVGGSSRPRREPIGSETQLQ